MQKIIWITSVETNSHTIETSHPKQILLISMSCWHIRKVCIIFVDEIGPQSILPGTANIYKIRMRHNYTLRSPGGTRSVRELYSMFFINDGKLKAFFDFLNSGLSYFLQIKNSIPKIFCLLSFLLGRFLKRDNILIIDQLLRKLFFHVTVLLDEIVRHSNSLQLSMINHISDCLLGQCIEYGNSGGASKHISNL